MEEKEYQWSSPLRRTTPEPASLEMAVQKGVIETIEAYHFKDPGKLEIWYVPKENTKCPELMVLRIPEPWGPASFTPSIEMPLTYCQKPADPARQEYDPSGRPIITYGPADPMSPLPLIKIPCGHGDQHLWQWQACYDASPK